jgi:hypothetical protein
MKLFALTLVVLFGGFAHAATFNECTAVGNSKSGIYFENGYRQPSPNASEHSFEDLVVVINGREAKRFQTAGDSLYRAECDQSKSDSSELNISKSAYAKIDWNLDCGDAKVQLQLDTDRSGKNGKIVISQENDQDITFDLICK